MCGPRSAAAVRSYERRAHARRRGGAAGCGASSWRAARRARDELVAERDPALLPQPRAGTRVDLGDLDPLRAHLRADPAARAVVERDVGRAAAEAVALGLGADVLRAGEEGRRLREGAERLADRALHAVVERIADELGHRVPSRIA